MCNQAGGLISRVIEESGIPTVNLSINRDITKKILPPRSVHVDFPHGVAFGEPQNVNQQMAVLRELLLLLQKGTEPGIIVDPPFKWRRTKYEEFKAEYPEYVDSEKTGSIPNDEKEKFYNYKAGKEVFKKAADSLMMDMPPPEDELTQIESDKIN